MCHERAARPGQLPCRPRNTRPEVRGHGGMGRSYGSVRMKGLVFLGLAAVQALSRFRAALIRARWVKAWGKLRGPRLSADLLGVEATCWRR